MTALRARVAELLEISPEEIDPDEELMDQGLDSVRLSEVLRFLRGHGVDLDYADLIEDTSLSAWEDLLDEEAAR
ncbi:phosphopantetheine-binding protein [Corynebacterium uropygiale]|uniref:Phosphopantetheine-binding protein n=1 Tax=Corynebacterium uropygiale TaxID=1775911 RepID=A0A9X1TYJ2_9CORY|nr:phosphopantetheine-binding protein [Corynebacterium uropygiale]MCF4007355.1 phosphopantetheine-binding protein [Corynebacterium uropygiale]